jgi:hypothetical protein
MQFLVRYEEKHKGYEDFKKQGRILEGDHKVAERCRGILRDYWDEAVKERGNDMDAVRSPSS